MTGVSGGAASGSMVGDAEVRGLALATQLTALDPAELSDFDLVEHLAGWERVASWAAAQQFAAAAQFARRPSRIETVSDDRETVRAAYASPGSWVREFADDEVAARLRISRQSAAGRLRVGCVLATMPLTAVSLEAGRIDARRAAVVAEECEVLDPATRRDVERDLMAVAERTAGPRLRGLVRAAVVAADPLAAHTREVRARGDRRVWVSPAADGMADLWAHLPAGQAMAIREALRGTARAGKADAAPGDDRTMDQRMADAIALPFVDALATGELRGVSGAAGQRLAKHRGRPAEIQVTVAASTLLGLDDAPAQLRGYGTITAQVARELAPDARWRRLLTDPVSGAVLDVGSETYAPTAAISRFVETRDLTCRFPGCGWPAAACELDHAVPFPLGSTSVANCGAKCPRHHHVKHSGAVRFTQATDGRARWVMPTGHTYDVAPPSIGLQIDQPEKPTRRTSTRGPTPPTERESDGDHPPPPD